MSNSAVSRLRSSGPSALIIAGILLALALISFSISDSDGAVAEVAKAPMPVSVAVARQSDSYEVERFFVGRVEARRESDAGFELGGMIAEVLVDDGDKVAGCGKGNRQQERGSEV